MHSPVILYIDIDETLIQTCNARREANPHVVRLVERLHAEDAQLYCWSAGGDAYAREVATELGIAALFQAFLPKPEVLIDDMPVTDWWMVSLHPDEVDETTTLDSLKDLLRRGPQ